MTKFSDCSCSHLAVNISRWQAICCAEQPPMSMGGSLPRYRAKKKGPALHRQKARIHIRSGAWSPPWTYISCNLRSTKLCFAGLYTGGSDGPTRDQVKASFFKFSFSAAVKKKNGWLTTSLKRSRQITVYIVIDDSSSGSRARSWIFQSLKWMHETAEQDDGNYTWNKRLVSTSRIPRKGPKRMSIPAAWRKFSIFEFWSPFGI